MMTDADIAHWRTEAQHRAKDMGRPDFPVKVESGDLIELIDAFVAQKKIEAQAAIDHVSYAPYSRTSKHYRDAEAAFARGDYIECIKCIHAAEEIGEIKMHGGY